MDNALERGLLFALRKYIIKPTLYPRSIIDLIYNLLDNKIKIKIKKNIIRIIKLIIIINLIYNR